jgi:hypothetical protein
MEANPGGILSGPTAGLVLRAFILYVLVRAVVAKVRAKPRPASPPA